MEKYDLMKKDTARANLSLENIGDIEFPLPPLPEQQTIVTTLDALSEKCRRLEEIAKRTIALCDDMKQALLRKAFNGEL